MPLDTRRKIARDTKVGDVMNPVVVSIQLGGQVGLAGKLMAQGGFHHLPVLDGKVLRGIVSQQDLYRNMLSYFFVENDTEQREFMDQYLHLEDVMSPDPITVGADQTVAEALDLMLEHRIGSIPVVNRMNELLGIVTDFDMLRALRDALA